MFGGSGPITFQPPALFLIKLSDLEGVCQRMLSLKIILVGEHREEVQPSQSWLNV
jgi:hypothetical protein